MIPCKYGQRPKMPIGYRGDLGVTLLWAAAEWPSPSLKNASDHGPHPSWPAVCAVLSDRHSLSWGHRFRGKTGRGVLHVSIKLGVLCYSTGRPSTAMTHRSKLLSALIGTVQAEW